MSGNDSRLPVMPDWVFLGYDERVKCNSCRIEITSPPSPGCRQPEHLAHYRSLSGETVPEDIAAPPPELSAFFAWVGRVWKPYGNVRPWLTFENRGGNVFLIYQHEETLMASIGEYCYVFGNGYMRFASEYGHELGNFIDIDKKYGKWVASERQRGINGIKGYMELTHEDYLALKIPWSEIRKIASGTGLGGGDDVHIFRRWARSIVEEAKGGSEVFSITGDGDTQVIDKEGIHYIEVRKGKFMVTARAWSEFLDANMDIPYSGMKPFAAVHSPAVRYRVASMWKSTGSREKAGVMEVDFEDPPETVVSSIPAPSGVYPQAQPQPDAHGPSFEVSSSMVEKLLPFFDPLVHPSLHSLIDDILLSGAHKIVTDSFLPARVRVFADYARFGFLLREPYSTITVAPSHDALENYYAVSSEYALRNIGKSLSFEDVLGLITERLKTLGGGTRMASPPELDMKYEEGKREGREIAGKEAEKEMKEVRANEYEKGKADGCVIGLKDGSENALAGFGSAAPLLSSLRDLISLKDDAGKKEMLESLSYYLRDALSKYSPGSASSTSPPPSSPPPPPPFSGTDSPSLVTQETFSPGAPQEHEPKGQQVEPLHDRPAVPSFDTAAGSLQPSQVGNPPSAVEERYDRKQFDRYYARIAIAVKSSNRNGALSKIGKVTKPWNNKNTSSERVRMW